MTRRSSSRRAVLVSGAVVTFVLHYAWEVGQAPFFTACACGNAADVGERLSQCLPATLGDLLLAGAAFMFVGAVLRDWSWPGRERWRSAYTLWVASGLVVTVIVERIALASRFWAYAPSQPVVLGIGALPLLQWLLIPAATSVVVRMLLTRRPAT